MMTALGLMSGTSMDGIDVALIRSDGRDVVQRGPAASYPYHADFRKDLSGANAAAAGLSDRTARPDPLRQVERALTERHAAAIEAFSAGNDIALSAIDVIGFHGQTVLHRPRGRTEHSVG